VFLSISGIVGILRPQIPDAFAFSQVSSGWLQSLPAGTGMAIFLYMGFEWVTPLGVRPKSYHWKVPVSMAISVGVLMFAYGSFVLGTASQLTRNAVSDTTVPQVLYLTTIYGPIGLYLSLMLALSATISTFNAGVMGGSRLIYMLAREGNLPGWCSSMSLRTGAPIGAVVLLSTLSLISGIAVLAWDAVLLVAVIGAAIICVLYSAFLLSALVLRRRRPDAPRPYRSRVWSPLQWFGVIGLPFLGLQTLLSEPSLGARPVYGGAVVLILATILMIVYGATPRSNARTPSPVTPSVS
jgi:ethanolamine permease